VDPKYPSVLSIPIRSINPVESAVNAAKLLSKTWLLNPLGAGSVWHFGEVEGTLRGKTSETGALSPSRMTPTLLQLCQNYMPLCVRIGKIDRLRTPLNA